MSGSAILARCCAATLLACVAAPTVAALAQRTFVASNGADTNPCSVTLPCRSFATAISKTNPTGEVIVLDSAGYGPVTITQSVAIIAPQGVYAGISVPAAQSGIVVNGSGIFVKLSGLTINGQGGLNGIAFLDGSRLVVERCTVVGMTGLALSDSASSSQLYVVDSTFRSSGAGIDISAGTATIDRVYVENNNDNGVNVSSSAGPLVDALVRDSVVSTSNGFGFAVSASASSPARLTVERSTAFQNSGHGFNASASGAGTVVQLFVTDSKALENGQSGVSASGAGAAAMVTGSTLARNVQFGMVQTSSSAVVTLQNNTVVQNLAGATSGTITKASVQ